MQKVRSESFLDATELEDLAHDEVTPIMSVTRKLRHTVTSPKTFEAQISKAE